MGDANPTEDRNALVTSYLRVRTAVGALAILLPIMLSLSAILFDAVEFVPSISEFFFTPMREALVGTIGAIAVFLISYKGYPRDEKRALSNRAEHWFTDRRVSYAAAIGALGVASFPSRTDLDIVLSPEPLAFALMSIKAAGNLHTASAALFFAALAVFCLSNFRRGAARERRFLPGLTEDGFYRACGIILILCILALGFVFLGNSAGSQAIKDLLKSLRAIFWIETIGLITFAAAWLTKGKARQTVPLAFREMVGRT